MAGEGGGDRMTIPKFAARKVKSEKGGAPLALLTAYDFPTAKIFDEAGVDGILVGDTLGVAIQGHPTTIPVTMDQMIYHTQMVIRAVKRCIVVGDMPFLSYQTTVEEAVRNAGRFIQEGGAHAVKLEGGCRCENIIRAMVNAQIPVMGHIGLTPQSIHKLGRYRVQRDEAELLADAEAVERAGAFAIVLEAMPSELSRKVTERVSIPTIGIGAGPHCDGQVLVWTDAFGMNVDFKAKFVKHYANIHGIIADAVKQYCEEVRGGSFPADEHSYH